jgi:hypothetical protein
MGSSEPAVTVAAEATIHDETAKNEIIRCRKVVLER